MISLVVFTIAGLLFLVLYLVVEAAKHNRNLKHIPLRICVTGTRGKSSVTRLIASILQQSGMTALAKTTGSKPAILFPDGSEKIIKRKGNPSILENKKIIGLASSRKVDAIVFEMMSIRPETLFVESARILKPDILILTNIKHDHAEYLGSNRAEIALSYSAAIPLNGKVIIPEEEIFPAFERVAEQRNTEIIPTKKSLPRQLDVHMNLSSGIHWEQNVDLATETGRILKLENWAIQSGIRNALPDSGSLRVWSIPGKDKSSQWIAAGAFSANDPDSTLETLEMLNKHSVFSKNQKKSIIGILNMRKDRGARTLQWVDAIQKGRLSDFNKIVFVGESVRPVKRIMGEGTSDMAFQYLSGSDPGEIMNLAMKDFKGDAFVFGMGNIKGMGRKLMDYWGKQGSLYDL